MLSASRNIIVFQPPAAKNELLQELNDHCWHLYVAGDADQAVELTKKLIFYVGLCLLDVCNDNAYLEKVEALLRRSSGINWILGLPREYKNDAFDTSREAKLITEYCYDYVTRRRMHLKMLTRKLRNNAAYD